MTRLSLLVALLAGVALPAAAQRARLAPRRPAPRPAARPAPKSKPSKPMPAAPKPTPAAPDPEPVITGFSGAVEAFNARTMVVEVRGADGLLYQADARNARFEVRVGSSERPAEFIDLRPGAKIEIQGSRPAAAPITVATLVRIHDLPARSRTLDPFTTLPVIIGPAATAPGPRASELRGVIRDIDRTTRILRLRTGGQEIPVRYTLTTSWEGINARSANAGYLRPGDHVRIEGEEFMGEWTAERIVLEPPGEQG